MLSPRALVRVNPARAKFAAENMSFRGCKFADFVHSGRSVV